MANGAANLNNNAKNEAQLTFSNARRSKQNSSAAGDRAGTRYKNNKPQGPAIPSASRMLNINQGNINANVFYHQ
jgi:hypothetical protein